MKVNQKVFQVVTAIALFVAVVFISVGFALMSQSLTIEGQARVVPANWSVHFDDTSLGFDNHSTAATFDNTASTYAFNGTQLKDYEVVLTKPGDHGTITFNVVNDGDIDAEVTAADFDSNDLVFTGTDGATKTDDERIVRENITYTVTWNDDSAIAVGDKLPVNATKTVKIDVAYDENADELPANPVKITGRDLTIVFEQDN